MSCDPRTYIDALVAYQPGLPVELVARKYSLKPENVVKLASNENPLGMSPHAQAAIMTALNEGSRYPENYMLEQALAEFYDLDPAKVVIASGSTGILDLIANAYLGEGREAVSSEYAFALYQIVTQTSGAVNVVVKEKNYENDLEALLAAVTPLTRVLWLTNPGNPTGTFTPYDKIKAFIGKVPGDVIVVLDEAYYEYLSPEDRVNTHEWIDEFPNLIVVRTFSKVYGLAGVRAGYALTNLGLAEVLNKVRYPFAVSSLAVAGATAALRDQDFVAKSAELNRVERAKIISGIKALGLNTLPAYGNFVTFKCPEALTVSRKLLEKGVIIRPLASYGMDDWLRVSVGLPDENDRFLSELAGEAGR